MNIDKFTKGFRMYAVEREELKLAPRVSLLYCQNSIFAFLDTIPPSKKAFILKVRKVKRLRKSIISIFI